MKNLKSVLAMIVAVCLMMCLAVPAFATAETTAATDATVGVLSAPAETEEGDIVIDFDDLENTDATKGTDSAEDAGDTTTTGTEEEHDHDHESEAPAESGAKKVIRIILTVLEVIASLALIVVVLVQSGKESGLSGALSGNSDSYMNKSGVGGLDKKLAKATKWVALVWILLTLILFLL